MVFVLTLAGVALSINPFTAILGGALLLIAFPWFLVRLVRETEFVSRFDVAPLIGGIAAAALLALVLDISGRDAEPSFVALCLGIGLMLYRFGSALARVRRAAPA